MGQPQAMNYQCWFCGTAIARSDPRALMIGLESFWRWHDAGDQAPGPQQIIYAHGVCAQTAMWGIGPDRELDLSLFGDDPKAADE